MADATWSFNTQGVAPGTTTSMIDVFNNSSRVVRVYEVYYAMTGVAAVGSVTSQVQLRRISAASAGSALTAFAFDTATSALDANITGGTGRTVTSAAVLRDVLRATGNPTNVAAGNSELLGIPVLAQLFSGPLRVGDTQPLVCRNGYGIDVYNVTSNTSAASLEIIFTDKSS